MSGAETNHLQILEAQPLAPSQQQQPQQDKAPEQAAEQQRPQQQAQPQQVLQLPQNPLQDQQGFPFPFAAPAGNGLAASGGQGMQGSGYSGPGAGEGALMGLGIGVPMGMGLGMGMPMPPLGGAHAMYGARAMAMNPYGAPTIPAGTSMPGAASLPGGTSSGSGGGSSAGGGSASGGDQSASTEEMKTLWVGGLQYWMDENYLWNCFAHTGELQSVKVIRNKATGYSEGYGFVEFSSHAVALNILQTYHGTPMLQCPEQLFRLNWASFGMGDRRQVEGPEFSIFVGDLANDVTDLLLAQTFRTRYPSVKGAKVVTDNMTGRSKGYGFVRFGSEEERNRAMGEMNGQYCSSRPMRLGAATPKKAVGAAASAAAAGSMLGGPALGGGRSTGGAQFQQPQQQGLSGEDDPNNTTVFVGGLDSSVSEDQLRSVFSTFGDIGYVKIPLGKGCGFVQFAERANAEEALRSLHGTMIGQQIVRLSWGRNTSSKQQRAAGSTGVPGGGLQAWGAQPRLEAQLPQQLDASFAQLSLQASPSLWAPQPQAPQQPAQGALVGGLYGGGAYGGAAYPQQAQGDGVQQPVGGVLAYAPQPQIASPFASQFGMATPFTQQQQQQQQLAAGTSQLGAFQASPFAVFPPGSVGLEQQNHTQQQPEASELDGGSAVLSSSIASAGSRSQVA